MPNDKIKFKTPSGYASGTVVDSDLDLYQRGVQITSTAAELNLNDGQTATATEVNYNCDPDYVVQSLTASGAVTAGVRNLVLNSNTVAIAATIATAVAHAGEFTITDGSATGTAAHTVTIATGTFDGTNDIATLNAPGERLIVGFDAAGAGTIILNTGSVALSATT
jgi:hypothetical protein